jgi:hypothetical protein
MGFLARISRKPAERTSDKAKFRTALGREAREHPRGEVLMSRRFRWLIPSPAMIVALVALAISLGSSAYALEVINGQQIEDNSVTGAKIQERSLRGHDLRKNSVGRLAINESRLRSVHSAKGLQLWALVKKDGTFMRGHGEDPNHPAAKEATGIYRVTFKRDVRGCSYQATIGTDVPAIPFEGGDVVASASPDKEEAVLVRTANHADDETDSAFQLGVIC